jgi:hypothetical protein
MIDEAKVQWVWLRSTRNSRVGVKRQQGRKAVGMFKS